MFRTIPQKFRMPDGAEESHTNLLWAKGERTELLNVAPTGEGDEEIDSEKIWWYLELTSAN